LREPCGEVLNGALCRRVGEKRRIGRVGVDRGGIDDALPGFM
jgi:hypothetical protein